MVHSEAESRISGDSRCSGKIRSASSASLRAQLCDNVRRPHENIPTSPCVPLYPPQNRLLSRVTSYVSRRPLPRFHLAWLDTPAASATGYIKKFAPPVRCGLCKRSFVFLSGETIPHEALFVSVRRHFSSPSYGLSR